MNINPKLIKPYLLGVQGYKGGKAADSSAQKVYKLSSNENPVGPSPKALEAIRKAGDDLHIYPDNTPQRLYDALGAYYEGLTEENFVAGNSGSEMLELLMTAFIREEDEVIVSSPSFLPYQMFSTWRGANIIDVPLKSDDYSFDVDGVLDAITSKTKLVFITSPNNPTGTYIPKPIVDQLVSSVPDDIIIVMDEVYYRFVDADDYVTALDYVKQGKQVIGLNSFSKSYGLAGLRLGYMYMIPELAAYIRGVVRPFLINSLSLTAAIAALEDEDWVEDVSALIKKNRTKVSAAMTDLGLKHWPTQGNFIMTRPAMGDQAFADALFQLGIMVRPVKGFGAPGCVRITIGDDEATDALINALQKVLST